MAAWPGIASLPRDARGGLLPSAFRWAGSASRPARGRGYGGALRQNPGTAASVTPRIAGATVGTAVGGVSAMCLAEVYKDRLGLWSLMDRRHHCVD